MKILNCFLTLFVIGVLITSCQKDETLKGSDEFQQPSNPVELRSYNQIDCGFAENFCEREPKNPPVVALVSGGDGGIKVSVKNSQYRIYPFEIFDGSTGIIVNDGSQSYIGHRSENSYLLSKTKGTNLPSQLGRFSELNYQGNFDISNVSIKIEENIGLSNIGSAESPEYVLTDDVVGIDITWIKECDYILVSKVENFVSVFFEQGDASQIEGFIEDAFNSCPPAYSDFQANIPNRCLNYCIDPRCVVDYLLDINAGLSDYQKRVLVSRYLEETLGLTDDEQNWLTFNDQSDLVYEIYNGLLANQNFGRCDKEDCGMAGGYHELIKQEMTGESLTADETEGLLEFFSVMSCDDPVIYSCFREAQQFPNSDISVFIEDVKSTILSNDFALLDGCNDLPQYADKWTYLANLDAANIPLVKDKIESQGYEYWVQTLENATKPRWWFRQPAVNMDYFGITISVLPNNPSTGQQFQSSNEFFNYIQSNFVSQNFYGEGSPCSQTGLVSKYFEFNTQDDEVTWSSSNPVSTIFTIHIPDDGSVICSEYNEGSSFIFSTINAPGWFNGDNFPVGWTSWDGYHPVSGNREFGITDNPDGTFTFYTTAVDRATGWWHLLGQNAAFEGGDEFWKCLLDTIFNFVEDNGGSASNDYNCTTVRPLWEQLKESLKEGCEGMVDSLDDFPCEQAEPCQ